VSIASELRRVVAELPGGGEARQGQLQMAEAVGAAIATGKHLIVEAGTGTGKSLGYLVPAILSGKRVVVATATKALQDQLANKDLPFLQQTLDEPFTFAMLKGRSNYVCLQRVHEHQQPANKLELDEISLRTREEIQRLITWSASTDSGDRADLSWEPSVAAWSTVSVGSDECPGAQHCAKGATCFAENARRAANEANVIVVNLHLLGVHFASGGAVLPEPQVVVIDEAHQLEDVISTTSGVEISGGRLTALSRTVRAIVEDDDVVRRLVEAGSALASMMGSIGEGRLAGQLPQQLHEALGQARERAAAAMASVNMIDSAVGDTPQKKLRVTKAAMSLIDDLDVALSAPKGSATWIEGTNTNPRLRVAPIDVSSLLTNALWEQQPTICTSATIPPHFARTVGLGPDEVDELRVGSPFDYPNNALMYCALSLPEVKAPTFEAAMHDELTALINAAGGRTLALFTSWRAMTAAATAISERVSFRVMTQSDFPKPRLIAEFSEDEHSCLFATAGLFQGIDVPGPSLSLVTIDRLPFPRPDDPLLSARRDAVGADAFSVVDLPRAATLLAQAVGRLIRSADDRGVVAVFDRRLGTARYKWELVNALPPMKRTRERAEAEQFLRELVTHRAIGT
jgi:ATP-dependent DNA helicase DinG